MMMRPRLLDDDHKKKIDIYTDTTSVHGPLHQASGEAVTKSPHKAVTRKDTKLQMATPAATGIELVTSGMSDTEVPRQATSDPLPLCVTTGMLKQTSMSGLYMTFNKHTQTSM